MARPSAEPPHLEAERRTLVAALTHDTGLVIGQVAVDAKSNEIPAVRDLLGMMNIEGVVITADALHTQRATSTFITSRGADYVLTVKANQPGLRRFLASLPWRQLPAHRSTERSHGRNATRTIRAVETPARIGFPGAAQVLQLRRTITRHGRRSVEVVYLICSRPMTQAQPATVAGWVRGHWAIEDRLHYVRDVTFDEDRCRVRTGSGAEVMAASATSRSACSASPAGTTSPPPPDTPPATSQEPPTCS